MPQKSGVLNALARLTRRWRRPRLGERLEPQRFLKHAAALAAKAATPRGLWLSLLVDGSAHPEAVARLRAVAARAGAAEVVANLGQARAPFVARFDLGGRLAPRALERIAAALAENPEIDALYTDEAWTDARGRVAEIVLKPAFDPVLLDAYDYFGRLTVYRRDRLLSLGVKRGPMTDNELALEIAASAPPGAILHLPYPAYLGPAPAAPARMRAGALAPGLSPDRLRPALPEPRPWPKVGVVVPSRDAPHLIAEALEGLFERTDYPDFEIVVVDNGTTDPRTLGVYARFAGPRLRVEIDPAPFNFSRAVNRGAALTQAPLLLLLNNDIEVIEPGWLKEMVACLHYPKTGVVGAKLIYPDSTLQHAGVIAGLGGYAGHWHIGKPESDFGPQRRLAARQSLSVVTGACMLVTRACFEETCGFDEKTFPIAYNDVDFCLRAQAAGWRTIWTPFAKLIHRESASRGSDETEANRARFLRDKAALQARHHTDVLEDRAYNPWAARGSSDPWPAARDNLPPARA